jgi:hypothetical protein
LGMQI